MLVRNRRMDITETRAKTITCIQNGASNAAASTLTMAPIAKHVRKKSPEVISNERHTMATMSQSSQKCCMKNSVIDNYF